MFVSEIGALKKKKMNGGPLLDCVDLAGVEVDIFLDLGFCSSFQVWAFGSFMPSGVCVCSLVHGQQLNKRVCHILCSIPQKYGKETVSQ